MSMTLYALIHTSGVAVFGFALYYNNYHVHFPRSLVRTEYLTAFPGRWKFLTVWNLALQLVYHSVSLINDAVGSSELEPKGQTWLQKLRDSLFASWAFPTGMFVGAAFWTIYQIDREAVYPSFLEGFVPQWMNHIMHTVPPIFVLLEKLVIPGCRQNKYLTSGLLLGGIAVYLSWIIYWNQQNGTWPYPILETLNNTQRVIFIGSSGLAIFGFYFLGEALYKWRWGSKTEIKGHIPKGKSTSKGKRKTK